MCRVWAPKAFEQAAGFLRIRRGDNPLDGTAVHPESYAIVEKMAQDLGVTVRELMQNEGLLGKLDPLNYVSREDRRLHTGRHYG